MSTTVVEDLLQVDGLTLRVGSAGPIVVNRVSFGVAAGEVLGIVGESGSGKTLVARSALRLEPPVIQRVSGSIRYRGRDLSTLLPTDLCKLRGAEIGMVFQEPMTSLNPALTIGRQMEEGLVLHSQLDSVARRGAVLAMLHRVGIASPEMALSAYPHQFSGGMRQRIMLASVMLLKPKLLIADEPTTALDAVAQRDVLELMLELTRAEGTAVMMISHDLSMVARYTDRIVVMEQGRVVEVGATGSLLAAPSHPYTKKLLAAMPTRGPGREVRAQAPIVAVKDIVVDYAAGGSLIAARTPKRALHGVSLEISPGEVVAIVGGSGSGKTTLGRAIAGLIQPASGEIAFRGRPIARRDPAFREYRLDCQMIFQDPYSSLDPRMSVEALLAEALRHSRGLSRRDRAARITETLDEVGLSKAFATRYPHELSGGQRQRVAIARAIIRRPAFVIADEPISALDMTVRAQILALFSELQNRHGFACLFISHDLAAVEQIADRVIVMKDGQIVEAGKRDAIFDSPQAAYTRSLLAAIPALENTGTGGVRLRWRLDDVDAATSSRTQ